MSFYVSSFFLFHPPLSLSFFRSLFGNEISFSTSTFFSFLSPSLILSLSRSPSLILSISLSLSFSLYLPLPLSFSLYLVLPLSFSLSRSPSLILSLSPSPSLSIISLPIPYTIILSLTLYHSSLPTFPFSLPLFTSLSCFSLFLFPSLYALI